MTVGVHVMLYSVDVSVLALVHMQWWPKVWNKVCWGVERKS